MKKLTRRNLLKSAGILGATAAVGAGSFGFWNWQGDSVYQAALQGIYQPANLKLTEPRLIMREIARFATMAPNSHNTQPWRLSISDSSITILPDLTRRCPVVDPDDHHLFVSLGCAAENAIQAGLAFGLRGEPVFSATNESLRVEFSKTNAEGTPLFEFIPRRQSTRDVYDGTQLSNHDLNSLEIAGSGDRVKVMLLTDAKQLESILDFIVRGNLAQMNDPKFVTELRHWIRMSYFEAVQQGDGLFARSSNHPSFPNWIGTRLFDATFTESAETAKYQLHIRSSAGIAVFVGDESTKSNWTEVGRCFERFALQATALGVLHAHVNQPVEIPEMRMAFADHLGIKGNRPDLVIRFGRGKPLPKSLRRPIDDVIDLA